MIEPRQSEPGLWQRAPALRRAFWVGSGLSALAVAVPVLQHFHESATNGNESNRHNTLEATQAATQYRPSVTDTTPSGSLAPAPPSGSDTRISAAPLIERAQPSLPGTRDAQHLHGHARAVAPSSRREDLREARNPATSGQQLGSEPIGASLPSVRAQANTSPLGIAPAGNSPSNRYVFTERPSEQRGMPALAPKPPGVHEDSFANPQDEVTREVIRDCENAPREPSHSIQPGTTQAQLPGHGISCFFDATGRLYTVRINAPFAGAVDGIRVGNSVDDLTGRLGAPTVERPFGIRHAYVYYRSPTSFERYDIEAGIVRSIFIGPR